MRDELLGLEPKDDYDLVTRGSAPELANLLWNRKISQIPPITYERFGTAMLMVDGIQIELVTARKESYAEDSRKPTVQPATLEEDAQRRDFTVNTLMRNLHTGELIDPLGCALADLESKVLRTPLDPHLTFVDDPLRMLRAVRFRWKLMFELAPGLFDAIREAKGRLEIVSMERIRDEFMKMLTGPNAPEALADLMQLGLFAVIAPEFEAMVAVEQGKYHHLDVWEHTLLALRNAATRDPILALSVVLHDVGKPPTRFIDDQGNTRFFGHEAVGESMSRTILRRLKFSEKDVEKVAKLVKNHMRLGTAPEFSASAARRLIRDLDGDVDKLLALVEADAGSLKPGVRALDLTSIRMRLSQVEAETPAKSLQSPLSGEEIMEFLQIGAGTEVGRIKALLTEKVLEGELKVGDKLAALEFLKKVKY